MLEKIVDGIYKIEGESNVYFLSKENIIIDCGSPSDYLLILTSISSIIDPKEIKTVIFTHLHYDHIANWKIFTNAKFYASKKEIESLNNNRFGTILLTEVADNFNLKLNDISSLDLPDYLTIIETPGHTIGSICLYDSKRKVLFSGDTVFDGNFEVTGRMDLPNSLPKEMPLSLEKLKKLDFDFLCSGHDY